MQRSERSQVGLLNEILGLTPGTQCCAEFPDIRLCEADQFRKGSVVSLHRSVEQLPQRVDTCHGNSVAAMSRPSEITGN